jgi:hypothetical protein
MKLWEKYCMSCYENSAMEELRKGYHEWLNGKWLTNLSGFIKINNPRLTIPKNKLVIDGFDKFMHKDLNINEITEYNYIKYGGDYAGKRQFEYAKDKIITLNNEAFNYMFKINDTANFYYIMSSNYAMYLYNIEYEFQGLVLGIKE